jgi:hypothetical protein
MRSATKFGSNVRTRIEYWVKRQTPQFSHPAASIALNARRGWPHQLASLAMEHLNDRMFS